MASFELQDELQGLQELDGYRIEHDHDFSTEDPEALLEGEYRRLSVNMILPLISCCGSCCRVKRCDT